MRVRARPYACIVRRRNTFGAGIAIVKTYCTLYSVTRSIGRQIPTIRGKHAETGMGSWIGAKKHANVVSRSQ